MTDDTPRTDSPSSSRRRFLGAAAATATAATAGCVGSLFGSAGATEIEPEEPSEPREGTPGEFYALLERNDLTVETLLEEDGELYLDYSSDAADEDESITEIEIVTTVYNDNLVRNDAGIETLWAENMDPFDGQTLGWAVETEWCEQYNATADDDGNETAGDGTVDDETVGNETDGNETDDGQAFDVGAMTLMNNVLNTRVYEADLENGDEPASENGDEDDGEGSSDDGDEQASENGDEAGD